jgi:hypothetical protein
VLHFIIELALLKMVGFKRIEAFPVLAGMFQITLAYK